jgi:hypothetical protein
VGALLSSSFSIFGFLGFWVLPDCFLVWLFFLGLSESAGVLSNAPGAFSGSDFLLRVGLVDALPSFSTTPFFSLCLAGRCLTFFRLRGVVLVPLLLPVIPELLPMLPGLLDPVDPLLLPVFPRLLVGLTIGLLLGVSIGEAMAEGETGAAALGLAMAVSTALAVAVGLDLELLLSPPQATRVALKPKQSSRLVRNWGRGRITLEFILFWVQYWLFTYLPYSLGVVYLTDRWPELRLRSAVIPLSRKDFVRLNGIVYPLQSLDRILSIDRLLRCHLRAGRLGSALFALSPETVTRNGEQWGVGDEDSWQKWPGAGLYQATDVRIGGRECGGLVDPGGNAAARSGWPGFDR